MSTANEIEISIEEARKLVDQSKKALALAENPVFKELVLDGYFKDEAVRLVDLYSNPNLIAQRPEIERDLHAIGTFRRYLSQIVLAGSRAEKEIEDALETLEEMRMSGED